MRTIVSAVLGGFLLAGLAVNHAEAGPAKGEKKGKAAAKVRKDPEQVFQKKDKDGDGSLSLEEMKGKGKNDPAKVEARFKRIDKDKNGMVTLAELKAGGRKKKKA